MRKILLIIFLLQGCTSNLYIGQTEGADSNTWSPIVVNVTNPSHKNFEVLKKSGIYEISTSDDSMNKLTLIDSETVFSCGNGLIPSIFTLGILPGYVNAGENFAYKIEIDGESEIEEYYLDLYARYSIWEWFIKPFRPSDFEISAKALSIAKKQRESGLTKN